jgi:hypothetical protein
MRIFAVHLGWFTTSGRAGIQYMILPAITLGWFQVAAIMRLVRSSMLHRQDVRRPDEVGESTHFHLVKPAKEEGISPGIQGRRQSLPWVVPGGGRVPRQIGNIVLEVEDLHTYCFTRWGVMKAVDGVSFPCGKARRWASWASPGAARP